MLEVNLSGVFLPAELLWAGVAFLLSSVISRSLSRTRFYTFVWHRALFDVALFLILWGAVSAEAFHAAFADVGGQ
jgi:protein AaeX